MIAVLFARRGSVYNSIPGVDVWDEDRDARLWPGGCSLVAHPPCRAWATLRHHARPARHEKSLAVFAIDRVRQWGGVLEHPVGSLLWKLPDMPGAQRRDKWGGWIVVVDQAWFGHRARKRTGLYICGVDPADVPAFPIDIAPATHTVGLWSGRNRETCRPSVSRDEYEGTPPDFARWLVDLARRASISRASMPGANG